MRIVVSKAVLRAVVLLGLCFALVLSPIMASVALATGGETQTTATNDATQIDTKPIAIDDDLPENRTVEVVVRLEDPNVRSIATDAVADRLEDHADRTQEPLLKYAADAPAIDVEGTFWLTNAVVLEVDTERVDLETFGRFDAVETVHRNFEVSIPAPVSDETNGTTLGNVDRSETVTRTNSTAPATTPGLAAMNVPSVWRNDTRGDGVRVAVLDTGIDATHPDLELYTDDPADPTFPGGWTEFDGLGNRVVGSTPHDTGIHGTHVSGTIAGGNATETAIGVAPDAELLHGLVLNEGEGTFAQIIAGMEWALAEGADVVNLSLGTTGRYAQFIDPVRNAHEAGTVVVAAIGNEGEETSGSPGNVYDAISAGAVSDNGDVASFSGGGTISRSDWETTPEDWPETYTVPTVTAPGVAVPSAVPGGYARLPGTSMASPHVAGTAALLLSAEPAATPSDVDAALIGTARHPAGQQLEQDSRYGYGIVDAAAAMATIAEGEGDVAVTDQTEQESTSNETESGGSQSVSDAQATDGNVGTVILVTSVIAAVLVAVALQRRER